MNRYIAALTWALATPALGAGFDIQVDNFYVDGGIATVVMKVTNNTGKAADSVFIDCAFLDKEERAIEIGKALIPAIEAGEFVYDKASAVTGDRVQYAACDVVSSR